MRKYDYRYDQTRRNKVKMRPKPSIKQNQNYYLKAKNSKKLARIVAKI